MQLADVALHRYGEALDTALHIKNKVINVGIAYIVLVH